MKALPMLVVMAVLLFAVGCNGGDGPSSTDDVATIDPETVGTVELSGLPPDGAIIIVNQKYFLMWQAAKVRIMPEETTLEALQETGVTIGEPAPRTPLAVLPAASEPSTWVLVPREPEEGEDESVQRNQLYLVYDGEAHLVLPQPLVGIAEFGIPDGDDPSVIERVRLPEGAPPATDTPLAPSEAPTETAEPPPSE